MFLVVREKLLYFVIFGILLLVVFVNVIDWLILYFVTFIFLIFDGNFKFFFMCFVFFML